MSAPSPAPRILVVEDEAHLAAGLKLNLELEGYVAQTVGSARDAGKALLEGPAFDALVLDVMLPDADGMEFCKKMRDAGDLTPVLMLTAMGTTDDRVRGLEVGADDYLVKPFELEELLARMRSILRRRRWDRSDEPAVLSEGPLRVGGATIDIDARTAQIAEGSEAGQEIQLTKLEFDLLMYFVAHPNRVLSRQELQEKVWRLENYPNTRMVDNFILRLRRYFEPNPSQPKTFVSVRGAGYKFVMATDEIRDSD